MHPKRILRELSETESLPRAALRAATEQREVMLPLLLSEIEAWITADSASRAKPGPLYFAFHLLAEWRATEAYRPLARLLSCPAEEATQKRVALVARQDVLFGLARMFGTLTTEKLPGFETFRTIEEARAFLGLGNEEIEAPAPDLSG